MRRHNRNAAAAGIAGVAAIALTAGLTVAPSAAQDRNVGSTPAGTSSAVQHPPSSAQAKGVQVTLITGDRVRLDGKGKVAGVDPAPGRESVPVRTSTSNGHTLVLPADAALLVARKKLDLRLFDVTELSRPQYRQVNGEAVPLIVSYTGATAKVRTQLTDDAGMTRRARLDAVDAQALTVRKQNAADAWRTFTTSSASGIGLAAGVEKISLDGLVQASLDVSVPQIGAPAAWQAGFDGTGVKAAVLDTGIDTSHPDLAGQVIEAKNFSDSPDTQDRQGHGTHVASTVAGTGAASQGKYKGVAPGAQLISAKVLNDDGYGSESGLIAGAEWAVEQGAKVINLSLGQQDTPGIDPLEETVNKLSDQALFVIASGNLGYGSESLNSPGSAESALTVGAVDKSDVLADFSLHGPRVDDGGLKPDLTAPGVDITAAAAEGSAIDLDPTVAHPAPGYLTISGTSMATPHVAGAAALLAQEHPDWSPKRLKETLVGSAEAGPYTPVTGGTGRVDVAKAVKQTVVSETASLNFGTQAWPHTDDQPVTRTVTYRNLGATPVTLNLSASGTDAEGQAAPTGFFTVSPQQVTVPAGGTAEVGVTADSRLGGDAAGAFGLVLTAAGGDQSVRTAGVLQREQEMHTLTIKATGRDGEVPANWVAGIADLRSEAGFFPPVTSDTGVVTVRMPRATYALVGETLAQDENREFLAADLFVQGKVTLDKDITFTMDSRKAKPLQVSVPDARATPQYSEFLIDPVENGQTSRTLGMSWYGDMPQGVRTQQIGGRVPADELHSTFHSVLADGDTLYQLGRTLDGGFFTGLDLRTRWSDLAKVTTRLGASHPNAIGAIAYQPSFAAFNPLVISAPLPRTTTTYLQGGLSWKSAFEETDTDNVSYNMADTPLKMYRGGTAYTENVNTGVFGPALSPGTGLVRDGDQLSSTMSFLADAQEHKIYSFGYDQDTSTTIYRNGKVFLTYPYYSSSTFEPQNLPKDRATYKLVTTLSRTDTHTTAVSTRITWETEFTSRTTRTATLIPTSVIRYSPSLALDATAKAGVQQTVPLTVQGSAAGRNLKSLRVYVSYDRGAQWSKVAVQHNQVKVRNPAAGGSVSFKADIEDTQHHTFSQTIIDAYLTR